MKIRCIQAGIYGDVDGHDCSNGGISSRFDKVLIPCENGFIDVDTDNAPDNLCRVVRRNIAGREYVHLEPENIDTNKVWVCFGGRFAYTCDSRFGEIINNGGYPVSIHDRCEH